MDIGHFKIPGDATKREYAVYIIVAKHNNVNKFKLYIGKTGDNREGCNPIISRIGNHFSFNKLHSQMRNKLILNPKDYCFSIYYTTFGKYIKPSNSKKGINLINEMERQLNKLCQEKIGEKFIINPYKGKKKNKNIDIYVNTQNMDKLNKLVGKVKRYLKS